MPQDKKSGLSGWLWPLGVLAAGVTGAAAIAVRGCWHRQMSWPVRSQRYSYQVCTACGVKRLFNEHTFQGYGPFSYELNELIAHAEETSENSRRRQQAKAEKVAKGHTIAGPTLIHSHPKEKNAV